ncbi:hypothetical protein LJR034_001042 [Caballeronia sp. LjRoot34]|uniref:hypothetical protein n=1 Tax=Caballeronia sp. LjRoot34 TaxID=3342325 RepID=UPI003ECF3E93
MLMTQMLLKCWKTGVAGGKSGFDERQGRSPNPYYPANGARFGLDRSADEPTPMRHFFHPA